MFCLERQLENTETNAIDVFTGKTVTNMVNYHVLVVDLLEGRFHATCGTWRCRATNSVVVQDSMKIVRTALFDTVN